MTERLSKSLQGVPADLKDKLHLLPKVVDPIQLPVEIAAQALSIDNRVHFLEGQAGFYGQSSINVAILTNQDGMDFKDAVRLHPEGYWIPPEQSPLTQSRTPRLLDEPIDTSVDFRISSFKSELESLQFQVRRELSIFRDSVTNINFSNVKTSLERLTQLADNPTHINSKEFRVLYTEVSQIFNVAIERLLRILKSINGNRQWALTEPDSPRGLFDEVVSIIRSFRQSALLSGANIVALQTVVNGQPVQTI